jgi:hypothetical protein
MMGRHLCPFRRARFFCRALFTVAVVTPMLLGGIRSAGKYNGLVFYDRWDNCYLFSGVYLMYVSEVVKETLRPYRGRSMEIDAKEVYQPMNPGDGLIKKLTVIGESKENALAAPIRGVELRASVSKTAGQVRAEVKIRNGGLANISIDAGELGFAVLAHDKPFLICPSDGTSCAVITRISATTPDGKNRVGVQTWGWTVYGSDRLPKKFTLRPGEVRTTSVIFDLPKGAYQFLAGYGGGVHAGPCVASAGVSFDVGPN